MLYDRPYMQSDQNPRTKNMVLGIIVFNVVMYAIQLTAGEGYFRLFALTANDYGGPKLWSFITYSFLHSPSNIGHIVGNMIGVFFLGRALLPDLGKSDLYSSISAPSWLEDSSGSSSASLPVPWQSWGPREPSSDL